MPVINAVFILTLDIKTFNFVLYAHANKYLNQTLLSCLIYQVDIIDPKNKLLTVISILSYLCHETTKFPLLILGYSFIVC